MTAGSKLFFITGVSSGFGQALAVEALKSGHRVIGTLRNRDALEQFQKIDSGNALGVLLDVTDEEHVKSVIDKLEADVGAIDVLVNNAGYGHEGLLEESSLDDLRKQFDVNVFGAVAVIKAMLPYMRKRRSGHIINITSMGGIVTFPGLSFYHGSKFALEGISETLAKETKGFGIHVTAVEPGAFRTNWAGRSMVRAPRTVADYDELFAPIRKAREERNGRQAGDPVKAALAILDIVESQNPPVHLLLGSDAVKFVKEKLLSLQAEYAAWEVLSLSTDYN